MELEYNKFYIGLERNGRSFDFIRFKRRKKHMVLDVEFGQSKEVDQMLDDEDFDYNYNKTAGRYRIRLGKDDIEKCSSVLGELIKLAFEDLNS